MHTVVGKQRIIWLRRQLYPARNSAKKGDVGLRGGFLAVVPLKEAMVFVPFGCRRHSDGPAPRSGAEPGAAASKV